MTEQKKKMLGYGGYIFPLTRDPLWYMIPLTHTNYPRPQHIPKPILTEPHPYCRAAR